MKSQRLRTSVALGTSFTALFLLVHCAVDERDYSRLNIGGTTSREPDDFLQADAGPTDASVGGPIGPEPLPPVPCDMDAGLGQTGGGPARVNDAGSADAGNTDGGSENTGSESTGSEDAGPRDYCACVDGFLKAVDADNDGVGTRQCSLAPGLDCDDGDATVTHNSCGGCGVLPNAVGEDCLDCGAYVCDGPDTLACASKPGPVEDPDCRCQDALLVARDIDQDGQGTRLCEANPGIDCNDGDETFTANQCGGCEPLPGAVGDPCNVCGAYVCNGAALVCAPQTGLAGRRCVGGTSQTCVGTGFWGEDEICANVCFDGTGSCEICIPGNFQCVDPGNGSMQVQLCASSSLAGGITWTSYASCTILQTCNPTNGTCTGSLMWPRDIDFDVVPRLQDGGLRWHEELNTASDSDYG